MRRIRLWPSGKQVPVHVVGRPVRRLDARLGRRPSLARGSLLAVPGHRLDEAALQVDAAHEVPERRDGEVAPGRIERDVRREPEVGPRRPAPVTGPPLAAGAGHRGDRPVRRNGPDAVRREVREEEAPVRSERDADRFLDGRLDRRAAVAVRADLPRAREDLAFPTFGIDAEHLVEEPVGDVDPSLPVDGEVVRQLEHRFGPLDDGGGLAHGVLPAAAADGEEQQGENGVTHCPWYTEGGSGVTAARQRARGPARARHRPRAGSRRRPPARRGRSRQEPLGRRAPGSLRRGRRRRAGCR